jgi:uncharacterized protein RhaS with RHS repeats
LSYFGARFYDPEVGRFLTQDPAKQGLNWYSYCGNNPLRYVDPDGQVYTEAIALTTWELNAIPVYGTLAYAALVISAAGTEYGPQVMQALQGLYSSASDAANKGAQGSQGSSNNGGNKDPKSKSVNLPSWKKVEIDMDHILSGHTSTGSRAVQSANAGGGKDLFGNMTPAQIEKAIRGAYRVCEKVMTQGDRVLVRGQYGDMTIEMWVNKATNIIETAYPK